MSIHTLNLATPAANWRQALPVGQGTLGGLVHGAIAHERILLNHERLFSEGMTPPLPDTTPHLEELRGLLREGQFEQANRLFPDVWSKQGYVATTGTYLPGPVLHLARTPSNAFEDYSRQLDFETGLASVDWKESGCHHKRQVFASREHGTIACLWTAEGELFDVALHWSAQDKTEATDDNGLQIKFRQTSRHLAWDDALGIYVHGPEGAECGALAHWRTDGKTTLEGDRLHVSGASFLYVLTSMVPQPAEAWWEEERARLAGRPSWKAVREDHIRTHAELYNRTRLDIPELEYDKTPGEYQLLDAYQGKVPASLITRLANYGRYLLISSSRAGGLPPNLQGIWNGSYNPAWNCCFFFNENLQMALWPGLPGGLPECVEPVFDLIESRLEDYRENARKLYGCKGVLLPLFMTPDSGQKKNPQAHVVYWTGSGAWLAQTYFDYWLFTGDREFLEKRALPFMREVAAFYEDFMVKGEDGLLHTMPSNSPENYPLGQTDQAGTGLRICADAAIDFALAGELFDNLLSAYAELGYEDRPEAQVWKRMRESFPAYRINEDGALAEWLDPRHQDNYHHRHLSHLYPVFPGWEISPETRPDLWPAALEAVRKRLAIGLADQTGWSLAHMANLYARLEQPAEAWHTLELLTRSVLETNLFTAHNDYRDMGVTMDLRKGHLPAFQIDANLGVTAAVYEMFVFARPGWVNLFPALPEAWSEGSLKGLRARGGLMMDLNWNRAEGTWAVRMISQADQTLKLKLPHAESTESDAAVTRQIDLQANVPYLLEGSFPHQEAENGTSRTCSTSLPAVAG